MRKLGEVKIEPSPTPILMSQLLTKLAAFEDATHIKPQIKGDGAHSRTVVFEVWHDPSFNQVANVSA